MVPQLRQNEYLQDREQRVSSNEMFVFFITRTQIYALMSKNLHTSFKHQIAVSLVLL